MKNSLMLSVLLALLCGCTIAPVRYPPSSFQPTSEGKTSPPFMRGDLVVLKTQEVNYPGSARGQVVCGYWDPMFCTWRYQVKFPRGAWGDFYPYFAGIRQSYYYENYYDFDVWVCGYELLRVDEPRAVTFPLSR